MKKTFAFILMLVIFAAGAISATATEQVIYEEAPMSLVNQYNAEIEALIEEIENSPTTVTVTGTKYYVSSSMGNDSNDGKSPSKPWKTIEKVNSMNYAGGDCVFFKRGDTWRTVDPLRVKGGLTVSAYGEGAKPKLICSVDGSDPNKWSESKWDNVYVFEDVIGNIDKSVGTIVFDGGRAWGIHVSALPNGNRIDNGTVFNGLEKYTIPYGPFSGPGDLQGNLEFYHDYNTGLLYLYSRDGNPGEVFESVEIVRKGHGITFGSNTLIDNIEVFGAGGHGASAGTVENVEVRYCVFKWIGGSVQGINETKGAIRYGNAVESYGSSKNFVMHHNYASQVYDCCWTAQSGYAATIDGLQIYSNVAEYANTGSEVWVANDGIVKNMQIHDNYDRYIGYGWSHQRPSNNSRTDKNGTGWIGAGGFFYGQGNTGMSCENNDVYNNVYMFAGSDSHSVGAVTPDKFNFHDNVYIMEKSKNLGIYAPFKGQYTKENIESGLKSGAEKRTAFYYTKDAPLGNMYALCLPEDCIPTKLGDINKDLRINSSDIIFLARHIAGFEGYQDIYVPNADVNRGGAVSTLDLVMLVRFWAGWSSYSKFPCFE